MRRQHLLPLLVASFVLSTFPARALAAPLAHGGSPSFIGSTGCAKCHERTYSLWHETLHANIIRDAKEYPQTVLGDFSAPDLTFKKEEILYTIGSHWDQRYMTKIDGEFYVLPKLWSVQSKQWRPYNIWSWKQRPWSKHCAGCHVTGYDPRSRDFVEMGIGCESCHGPGGIHAASSKAADIINPAKLPPDRRDMICAACHVRGMDLSGTYYYPVGYLPGDDLAALYRPVEMEEGEPPGQAIARIYNQWQKNKAESAGGKCEVCGIYGSSERIQEKIKAAEGLMAYCLKCHDFGKNLTAHTHHPASAKLVCLDCHKTKPYAPVKEKVDIHTVNYYRIHKDSCYDEDIHEACVKCHVHAGRSMSWALREILVEWKKLPELDH